MQPLFQFFGRLHPMVLHAPIGLLLGLAAVEAASLIQRRPVPTAVRSMLVWLAAASAVVTAGAGYVLSLEPSYDRSALQWHQWLGIGAAAGCVLAAILQQVGRTAAFRAVLLLTVGAIIPGGHLGASVTHGEGFLTAPFTHADAGSTRPARPTANVANSTYGLVIAPIFESKCNGCHSQSRHKGGLSLEEPGAISKGGKNGPVIVPGEPEASEMVRRLRLPLDDDDHMPPPSKAQPAPEEVGAIAAWIAAGARFEGMDADRSAPARPTETVAANDAGATQARKAEAVPPADPAAIGALRDRLVHVEPVQRGSNLLVVDFSAIAGQLSAPQILSLLEPVREQVADLSIARSPAGDDVLKLAARMPNLKRLNATATPITDAGVAELAHHQHLEELVLTQDHLTDSAAEYLLTMPALKRVYVWKSGISAASLDGARERSVIVDAGEFQASQADESETEVKLTGDAPVPGKTVPAGVDALKPVNTVCPVSGKAVDPNFAVVYKGRVIGFCCAVCASQFLADPAKFEDKVH